MPSHRARFVYGPVPSRRLGRSLGVDLVSFKVCSYDCIYCQLGRTTVKTVDRAEHAPVDAILDELRDKLQADPKPDYIGLAGSGEPTLHEGIGSIIRGIKAMTAVPVAVLTNGSLLWKTDVRNDLAAADLVMPSLDAGDAALFSKVNRPHPSLHFETMVQGLTEFASTFAGQVWLEVFLLDRLTGNREQVEKIADMTRRIAPDRVQLNSVARPAADPEARAVQASKLEALASRFDVPTEVVHEGPPKASSEGTHSTEEALLALLGRRPCTVSGIATGLAIHRNEVIKHLSSLRAQGRVRTLRTGDDVFFEVLRE